MYFWESRETSKAMAGLGLILVLDSLGKSSGKNERLVDREEREELIK